MYAQFPTAPAPAVSSDRQVRTEPLSIPTLPSGGTTSYGSVMEGKATATELALSLSDAITRGLRTNLGPVLGQQQVRLASAAVRALNSSLLPNISAAVTESAQQINLSVFGLPRLPGTPPVVGPIPIFDARAYLSAPIVNFTLWSNVKAQRESESAARFSYTDARELVVLTVTDLYLQSLAAEQRIQTAQAQLETANAVHRQAVRQQQAGVVAGIDVLRAQVQRQAQQQRLIYARNESEKAKLRLARAIGLPLDQHFQLADRIPYTPPPFVTVEEAVRQSLEERPDYRAAMASVRAAELTRRSAHAQRLPSLDLNVNYGAIGQRINDSHGTITAAGGLRFPVFTGGRIRADEERADALLAEQRTRVADLEGRIAFETRTALLDMSAANEQVQVAREAVDLAQRQLTQARDRFAAGVANSLEVVQSQEAVANSNENFISAVYVYNAAKASLARALGSAEKRYRELLGVR